MFEVFLTTPVDHDADALQSGTCDLHSDRRTRRTPGVCTKDEPPCFFGGKILHAESLDEDVMSRC